MGGLYQPSQRQEKSEGFSLFPNGNLVHATCIQKVVTLKIIVKFITSCNYHGNVAEKSTFIQFTSPSI